MRKPFRQPEPVLGEQYEEDRVLRSYLRRNVPAEIMNEIEPELHRMGRLAGGPLFEQQMAELRMEPTLTRWDAWGGRIDRITPTPLWERARKLAVEFGLTALAHENPYGRYSRIYQFALAYLFHPSTDVYTCPLAMTDGAVRALVSSGNRELIDRAVPHLTSRNPDTFWTSGQWMTESTGGSDVGRSETRAEQDENGTWRLYGRKWFTSAAASEMALTLARPGTNLEGGGGLAMFYVETRDERGNLRNIVINRLKDKLGTRKLPTAELSLEGTPAVPVSGLTGGVAHIVPMLHLTRTWNAVMSAASMRRGMALTRDYSLKRVAFGAPLIDQPLHADTLAGLQAETEAAFHLGFYLVELLGRDENNEISDDQRKVLRLLSSIAKLTTGKQAVAVSSEILETFGGAGYVEDTGLPVLLRDSQVLPIWEGTTNILSLDVLRASDKDNLWPALLEQVKRLVGQAAEGSLKAAGNMAVSAMNNAAARAGDEAGKGRAAAEAGARRLSLTMGRATALALMVDHARWALAHEGDRLPMAAACRFAANGIDLIRDIDATDSALLAKDR